jgi:hypothetical protein
LWIREFFGSWQRLICCCTRDPQLIVRLRLRKGPSRRSGDGAVAILAVIATGSRRGAKSRRKDNLVEAHIPEEDYPMENYISKVNYFCVGLGIGALAGILFAPKSGAETRDDMTRKFEEGKAFAQDKVRELRERAEDVAEASAQLKESLSGAFAAGRKAFQREMSKAG